MPRKLFISSAPPTTPAAVAGCPSITVPAGALQGLPIGISFFAGPYAEPMILGVAFAYEQATKRRTRPRFLPTIDLEAPAPAALTR